MRWRNLVLAVYVIAALSLSALVVIIAISQATDRPESPQARATDRPESLQASSRLSTGIIGDDPSGPIECYFDARVSLRDGKVDVVEVADALVRDLIRPGDAIAVLPIGMDVGIVIPAPVHMRQDGQIYGSYAYCQEQSGALWSGSFGKDANGGDTYEQCFFDAMVTIEDEKVGVVEVVETTVEDSIQPGKAIAGLPEDLKLSTTIPGPVYVHSNGTLRAGYSSCEQVLVRPE